MPQESFHIDTGTLDDLEILVSHRLRMFEEIRPDKKEYLQDFDTVTEKWIARKLNDSNFLAFIAKNDSGTVVGSGCILIKEDQPRPANLRIQVPYLLSMYTEPEFRGKGVGSMIVRKVIEWSKDNGYDRIDLHASPLGRPMYEKFGFTQTNEMRLLL